MQAITFYEETRIATQAFDGQYPRPWMTDLTDPLTANCFIVGKNQRNGYAIEDVGSHQRHLDALFNRNGYSCRGLYESLGYGSPTRRNIDRLSARLTRKGAKILETNVICFSSPMSADLTRDQRAHGTRIFRWLLNRVAPEVIVVHGAGAAKELAKIDTAGIHVVEMDSLAPPAYNKWSQRSDEILDSVAETVSRLLKHES